MRLAAKDGNVFDGESALAIVEQMRQKMFDRPPTIREYIDRVVELTHRFEGVELDVIGIGDEERAESLLSELERTGLACRS